jgi:APA family basic amino acid/polyamine antiporter
MALPTLPAERPVAALTRSVGAFTATCVVVANVIGAGIFTTPGFLARDLESPFAVLSIWVLGAILALAGALSYSELGAALPRAGGEYIYLREAYGPLWGFLSGWTSFFAGFAAPIAAACIGFSAYLSHFSPGLSPSNVLGAVAIGPWRLSLSGGQVMALLALWFLTMVHITGVQRGGRLQVVLTAGKIATIVALIIVGLLLGTGDWGHFRSGEQGLIPSSALTNGAVSLIFVLYCYSGWNAAVYLAGEVKDPNRTIPFALLAGTGIVMVLYMALNVLFLYALPISEMSGVLEIGEKASQALFGPVATYLVAAIMALSILASASAMILAGPRVYFAMASDGLFPKRLAGVHGEYGSPAAAIFAQSLWISVLILTGTFEQLVVYSGFALVLFSALAVGSVMVLRWRRPELSRPFRVPLYPVTPLLFLGFSAWILWFTLRGRPAEALFAIGTMAVGLPLYFFWRLRQR